MIKQLFGFVEHHPETATSLKKPLDYYLPMLVKFLNHYADMDALPVQSEAIAASKREIEGALDTLTSAFEKLLERAFQPASLDISTDIFALNAVLAQEGLVEDALMQMLKTAPSSN